MKTSKRFRFGHWFCLTLIVGLGFSLIYFAHAHRDTDPDSDYDVTKNAGCSAIAVHYHYGPDYHGYYSNWQWAGFTATLGKTGNPIGTKVKGDYTLDVWVNRHLLDSDSFELKVRGIKLFGKTLKKWGDSTMGNISDFGSRLYPYYTGICQSQVNMRVRCNKTM